MGWCSDWMCSITQCNRLFELNSIPYSYYYLGHVVPLASLWTRWWKRKGGEKEIREKSVGEHKEINEKNSLLVTNMDYSDYTSNEKNEEKKEIRKRAAARTAAYALWQKNQCVYPLSHFWFARYKKCGEKRKMFTWGALQNIYTDIVPLISLIVGNSQDTLIKWKRECRCEDAIRHFAISNVSSIILHDLYLSLVHLLHSATPSSRVLSFRFSSGRNDLARKGQGL